MKRWSLASLILLSVGAFSLWAATTTPSATKLTKSQPQNEMTVRVTPWGPTQETMDAAKAKLVQHPELHRFLRLSRNRLVSFELVQDVDKGSNQETPPNRFRGTFYDYTNNQTLIAEGSFDRPDTITVNVVTTQPLPSPEEFDDAVGLVRSDPRLGPALSDGRLQVYRPMPPLYIPASSKGRVDRAVNVGLMAKDSSEKSLEFNNEVVSVNLSRGTVIRFPDGAPPTSKAGPNAICGPGSGGGTSSRGVAGQFNFTINAQDGSELWSFLAIRPSASSGADASGIELRNVKYKGHVVLKLANVPILNVSYDNNTCGPFRDWEYSESDFDADPTAGVNVAPGVRSCSVAATTQLDTGIDTGNHQGIAYYKSGDQVILVSEMSAGWYRYISEWGFHEDGRISPRFGMGATANSCTCNGHVHHAYWRLDFDIDGNTPNRITEGDGRIRPAAADTDHKMDLGKMIQKMGQEATPQRPIFSPNYTTEVKRYRDKTSSWLIKNPATGRTYQLLPNDNDGTALNDSYGKGDFWALLYRKNEFDDSLVRTNTSANVDAFLNDQAIMDTDIVIWYGIHINHNRPGGQIMGHPFISGQFVAGPELIPVRW
jgi:hypothetical protein